MIADDMQRRARTLDGLRALVAHFEANPELIPLAPMRFVSGSDNPNEYFSKVVMLGEPSKKYRTVLHRGMERDFGGGVILDVYMNVPPRKVASR